MKQTEILNAFPNQIYRLYPRSYHADPAVSAVSQGWQQQVCNFLRISSDTALLHLLFQSVPDQKEQRKIL